MFCYCLRKREADVGIDRRPRLSEPDTIPARGEWSKLSFASESSVTARSIATRLRMTAPGATGYSRSGSGGRSGSLRTEQQSRLSIVP